MGVSPINTANGVFQGVSIGYIDEGSVYCSFMHVLALLCAVSAPPSTRGSCKMTKIRVVPQLVQAVLNNSMEHAN